MPTYDYQCQACDHTFEEFQSMSAKHLKKCPECGKNKLVRLIGTGAGVIFKGSGFYETDYRSDGYKKDAKAESESGKAKPDGEKKPEGSSTDTGTKAKTDKPDKPQSESKSADKKPGGSSSKSSGSDK